MAWVTIYTGETWGTEVHPADPGEPTVYGCLKPIEIPDELWAEYQRTREAWFAVVRKLDQYEVAQEVEESEEALKRHLADIGRNHREMTEDDAANDWDWLHGANFASGEFGEDGSLVSVLPPSALFANEAEREDYMLNKYGTEWRDLVAAGQKRREEA